MKLPKYFTERKHEQYNGNWWTSWHTGFETTLMNILAIGSFLAMLAGIAYLIWSELL